MRQLYARSNWVRPKESPQRSTSPQTPTRASLPSAKGFVLATWSFRAVPIAWLQPNRDAIAFALLRARHHPSFVVSAHPRGGCSVDSWWTRFDWCPLSGELALSTALYHHPEAWL
jgi:hypothetical protein